MNSFFSIRSFNRKLLLMVMATALISLLLVSSALTYISVKNYKFSMQQSIQEKARLLTYNLVPMMVFDDSDSAKELMASFSTNQNILSAQVIKKDVTDNTIIFAEYIKAGSTHPKVSIDELKLFLKPQFDNELIYSQVITFEGDEIGYLHMHRELTELDDFFIQSIAISTVILMFSFMLVMIVSVKFQFILLQPLQHLIDKTQQIRQDKNYALRADIESKDEFADLAHSFNHMLEEIETNISKQLAVETEVRQLNLALEDKVQERTLALEQSNNELVSALSSLQDSQQQLVEKETMASLGQLVAGIAHEVNTPVGIGVTAISHLSELHRKLNLAFEEKTLSAKEMKHYIATANETIEVMDKSLNKAAELVSSFKQVAVDQSSDNIRPVKLDNYLQEILTTLKPKLKRLSHHLHIDCSGQTVNCNAGALYQIITNLIMNTLLHAFDENVIGHIRIHLFVEDQRVHIHFSDDGKGMNEADLHSLFEPFFTTKRGSGGTGLGTHIIYNLVTQALKGEIKASSKKGQGLSYKINFPIG